MGHEYFLIVAFIQPDSINKIEILKYVYCNS